MKVQLINSNGVSDISQLVKSKVWSGDYQQAARKLEINIIKSSTDKNIPVVNINPGNMIRFLDDNRNELFQGYVFDRDKTKSSKEIKYTIYDGLYYLVKDKGTYNFKKMTAEGITKKVASDFNIPIGNLASTGIVQSIIVQGETIYDIIMKVYTTASKHTGKKYIPIMQNGKLNVIEKGKIVANYILSEDTNIIDATYSDNIENMVNRVKIYDDKNNYIGKVENSDWIKLYGIFQDVYTKEKGKNANTEAKAMLKDIERTASINVDMGDNTCITGNAVKVKETFTGLVGLFYIDSDTHTFENGHHKMELGLSFQNMMDEKE